jgi:outer membrane protein insertion porin family
MKKLVWLCLLVAFRAVAQSVDYSIPIEYELGGVRVEGAEFLDKNSLIAVSGLGVGQKIKIPGDDITTAIRKLWNQGIIGDAKIFIEKTEGNKVFLIIKIKERPRMTNFTYSGIKKGQQETLKEKVKLTKGVIITSAMKKNAENTIKKHYFERGFRNCKVTITEKKDSTSAIRNGALINIDVQRGRRVKIKTLDIEGVKAFEIDKISRQFKKTKQRKFGRIFKPSKFIEAEYNKDKEKLSTFYSSNGFRNFRIISDSVWDVDNRHVGIKIKIEEGRKFYHRNISWVGNSLYTDEQLNKVLGIDKGAVYNPEDLNKRLTYNPQQLDISSLYMDDGYLFFNINPVEVNVEGDSIDIEMRIFEGEQATINRITIHGNSKTSDHVILREIRTIPGQKFSRSDLIRTHRELATLGYFDPEKIQINPQPNMANGTVDIEYRLEERPSDQIELSGGWGGFFGFVGTLGVVFNNFSIKNIANFDKYRPLPAGDGQRLQLRLQANGRRFQSYTASFTEPWLGGRKPNSLTVSLNHSVQRLLTGTGRETGSLKVSGATLALGRRLTAPDDYFTLSNSLSYMLYQLKNFNSFGFGNYNNGTSNNITFNTTLSRNSIDNPMYPSSGSQITLSSTITPPYSLFGNQNFEQQDPNNRFRWVEYHKWMFDNSWFLPLTNNKNKLVLNARAHVGYIGTYNSRKGLGPFERFVLGGSGIAMFGFLLGTDIIGLRGYSDNSITPADSQGAGGVAFNKFVLELRYPVSLNPSATIYLLSFVEGGNNWNSFREFSPFTINRSAGAGVRIFMPAFGLLGIDWGYGFDRLPGATSRSAGQFHFTIGQMLR